MLVVIVIMTILLVATLPVVLEGLERRGVREGSRLVQAALTAARDRALSEQRTYGVRLVRDQSDRWLVTSMEYVAVPQPYTRGRATVNPLATPQIISESVAEANGWNGLVQAGDRIRLLDSGPIYTVVDFDPLAIGTPDQILIDRPYIGPPLVNASYQILRQPQPVAGAEPLTLPPDVVINVSPNDKPAGLPSIFPAELRSRFIPFQFGFDNQTAFNFAWVTGNDGQPGAAGVDDDRDGLVDDPALNGAGWAELGFPLTDDRAPAAWPPMEILFAPSGLPTELAANNPMIHFWVEKRGSTTLTATSQVVIEDALLVTLFTRTGFAQSFELNLEDADIAQNIPANYYFYAEQAFGSATQ